MNAARLEQCDICCDISQQVHNTNLKHLTPYRDGLEVFLALSEDHAIV